MKDEIGDRMKGFYESRSKTELLRRTPVIVRVDGRSFSKFCKRFEYPYDEVFNKAMANVMLGLCTNLQGAKFAERHSDEISVLLTDYDRLNTDALFDYSIQKICSVTASLATSLFIKEMVRHYEFTGAENVYRTHNLNPYEVWPHFDSRCFNIPTNEIANYYWWRFKDATRNSVQMWARANYSHKWCNGKSTGDLKKMLLDKNINWDDLSDEKKAGNVCMKILDEESGRNKWNVLETPCENTLGFFQEEFLKYQ